MRGVTLVVRCLNSNVSGPSIFRHRADQLKSAGSGMRRSSASGVDGLSSAENRAARGARFFFFHFCVVERLCFCSLWSSVQSFRKLSRCISTLRFETPVRRLCAPTCYFFGAQQSRSSFWSVSVCAVKCLEGDVLFQCARHETKKCDQFQRKPIARSCMHGEKHRRSDVGETAERAAASDALG